MHTSIGRSMRPAYGASHLTDSRFVLTISRNLTAAGTAPSEASQSKMKAARIPQKWLPWFEARKKYRLSHAQVQMARELSLNPSKFGGLANHRQEPWKVPLPQFMEEIYRKRFGVDRPGEVISLEDAVVREQAAKERKRELKRERLVAESDPFANQEEP